LEKLQNKVAAITGAGSGIGRATALLFAKEGAKVVVLDKNDSLGVNTESAVKKMGYEGRFVHVDVSKESDVKRAIEEVLSLHGKLDVMFNNAGIILVKDVVDCSEEDWEAVVGVNLKGVFLGSKYAAAHMVSRRTGTIINTASIYGMGGAPSYAAYCATKAGVIGFTRALALELAPRNVRVNCICPGVIDTPMLDQEIAYWTKKQRNGMRDLFLSQHPLGRLGKPEDVAHAALYLASEDSSFVTGSLLTVDGGYTAA
jgi:meso-butanediol dehydrogenase/(S,S)-butanediol dehydrogenase/diacetyl reductase